MRSCYHSPCDSYNEIKPNVEFLAKIIESIVWATADLAGSNCKDDINEIFEKSLNSGGPSEKELKQFDVDNEDRPVVTVHGIMEILHHLGKLDPNKLATSVDKIKANISHYTKKTLTGESPSSKSTSKLTITIQGKDSKFFIPLQIAHYTESKKKKENLAKIRSNNPRNFNWRPSRNPLETRVGSSLVVI